MALRYLFLAFACVAVSLGADDGWGKVKAVGSGTELRITIIGSRTPVLAQMDEATEDSLIIRTKTEQRSIPKEQIDKIENRAGQIAPRMTRQTQVDNLPVNKEATRPTPGPARTPGPPSSASTSYSKGSKPEFELLWKRSRRD